MFTLGMLFEQLHYGELRGVEEGGNFPDVCGNVSGAVQLDDYPKLISHVNFGLINLYTKFPLLEREVLIRQVANKTRYTLNSKYALTNTSSKEYKYIIDSERNPFTDDVIRINSVYSECSEELPINDDSYCNSLYTPTYDVLQVPDPELGKMLSIIYRAKHPRIELSTTDLDTEIRLPEVLWEALGYYVTSRVHASRANGQELSQIYLSRYYNRIAEVIDRNVFGANVSNTNMKLRDNGWV